MSNILKFEITAADFNGKTFDGVPFKLTEDSGVTDEGTAQKTLTAMMIINKVSFSDIIETDYATWNLILGNKSVAKGEPGDIVVIDIKKLEIIDFIKYEVDKPIRVFLFNQPDNEVYEYYSEQQGVKFSSIQDDFKEGPKPGIQRSPEIPVTIHFLSEGTMFHVKNLPFYQAVSTYIKNIKRSTGTHVVLISKPFGTRIEDLPMFFGAKSLDAMIMAHVQPIDVLLSKEKSKQSGMITVLDFLNGQ